MPSISLSLSLTSPPLKKKDYSRLLVSVPCLSHWSVGKKMTYLEISGEQELWTVDLPLPFIVEKFQLRREKVPTKVMHLWTNSLATPSLLSCKMRLLHQLLSGALQPRALASSLLWLSLGGSRRWRTHSCFAPMLTVCVSPMQLAPVNAKNPRFSPFPLAFGQRFSRQWVLQLSTLTQDCLLENGVALFKFLFKFEERQR